MTNGADGDGLAAGEWGVVYECMTNGADGDGLAAGECVSGG